MTTTLPKKAFRSLKRQSMRSLMLSAAFALLSIMSFSQMIGDYQAVSSGDWTSTSTWEYYDGTTWGPASNYPGEAAVSNTVTIKDQTIQLTTNVTAFQINNLVLVGAGVINVFANQTIDLNVGAIKIIPSGSYTGPNFTFSQSQSSLRIPANAYISFPSGYAAFPTTKKDPNRSCDNNNALYLGGGTFGAPEVKYSSCKGGGNVCVVFDELNDAGGTIHVVPEIILASDVFGSGNQSCLSTFEAYIRISNVITNGQVSLNLSVSNSGTIDPSTFTNLTDGGAADIGPAGDKEILVKVMVSVPGTGSYSLNANATLSLISGSGPCANFSVTTSNAAEFSVLPTPSITSSAPPTGLCIGESASISLSNNSIISTTVFYNLNGGAEMSVNLGGLGAATISVANGMAGDLTYTIDSIKYSGTPPCKHNIGTVYNVTVADATSLANDDETKTQDITSASLVTASQGCRAIATVAKTAGTFTTVSTQAYVDMPYVEYNLRPFVGRRVMIHPTDGSATADITLYAYPSEFAAFNTHPTNLYDLPNSSTDVANIPNIRVIKFDEGDFDPVTGIPTGGSPTEYTPAVTYNVAKGWWEMKVTGISSFSLFVISDPTFAVLPLKLLSFDAQLSGKRTAALTWKTAEERNVRSFDVEASANGRSFSKVGEVTASNTLSGAIYQFNTAMPGKLGYFRIRMIDKDGAARYSSIKMLKTDDLIINSYPNPVSNQLTVDLTGYPSGMMRIIDMNGRNIGSYKTVDGINRINTSALGAGMYMLQVNVGLETEILKFSKIQP